MMRYKMLIGDSTYRSFVVETDSEPGKVGLEYVFNPVRAKVIKPGYDERDLHYFNRVKDPIPVGTELMLEIWWCNLYGAYYRVRFEGSTYDVKAECFEIDVKAFMGR